VSPARTRISTTPMTRSARLIPDIPTSLAQPPVHRGAGRTGTVPGGVPGSVARQARASS
jgi:hypothetical protein